MKSDAPKLPKQAKTNKDGVKNHKISISINFNSENLAALKTPRGLSGSLVVTLTK